MSEALAPFLHENGARWSVGTPRAVLAFAPSRHDPGAARLTLKDSAPLLAFETISADPLGWGQGIALLVPDPGPIPAPSTIRPAGDGGLDLGLGDGVMRAFFYPDDARDAARFHGHGFAAARAALEQAGGRWVIETSVATLEIASPGGAPVLHCLPGKDMRHPATTPVPAGFVPAAHVFPRHPLQEGRFDSMAHNAFQTLLSRHGRPDLWRLKQSVLALLERPQGGPPLPPIADGDRHGRTTVRVALRQWWHETGRPPSTIWLRDWDPALAKALGRLEC